MSDLRKTWTVIRSILGTKKKNSSIKKLIVENREIVNSAEISETFNKYFHEIPTKLESEIPLTSEDPFRNISPNLNSIFFHPVTPFEIENVISRLKKVRQDVDALPVKLLIDCRTHVSGKISNLINRCFSAGIFPDSLKNAHIIPILKSGCATDLKNYRPISLLPVLGKIFEKCLYQRLYGFLMSSSIISPFQFGFMRGRSTQDAITSLTEYIYETLNNRQIAIAIFIDLTKAFDTVNHNILLKKLSLYGIRGLPLKLLDSYLQNRTQTVIINNVPSSKKIVNVGVPQGSILGPLLFLLYINNLSQISDSSRSLLFADDTTICFRGPNMVNLVSLVNSELEKLVGWANANRLTINLNKTFYMVFSNLSISSSPTILMNHTVITQQRSGKFLGVIVDDRLSFREHISYKGGKISKSLGKPILNLKSFIPRAEIRKVFGGYS